MRTVPELQSRGKQIDEDCRCQLVDMVMVRVLEIAHDKSQVERHGEHDEESEDDFFKIHE